MSKLTGWQIICTRGIGGPESGFNNVYKFKDSAEFRLSELKERSGEWESHTLRAVDYEMLNDTKCDADGFVATVDCTTKAERERTSALLKLSEKEHALLGCTYPQDPKRNEFEFVDWWNANCRKVINRADDESSPTGNFRDRWIARLAWHQARGTMP